VVRRLYASYRLNSERWHHDNGCPACDQRCVAEVGGYWLVGSRRRPHNAHLLRRERYYALEQYAYRIRDFARPMSEELRHYCRHCRGKLAAPTGNHREAFDSKGCHGSFYLHRCVVCEKHMPRLRESQRTCYRAECKKTWAQNHGSQDPIIPLKTSIKQGVKEADNYGRRWIPRTVSSEITPNQFHCATVPDGTGCQWEVEH
jgi:hypothetical protein